MNNEVKAKKHMLCEKAPFLAMILGCLIALVVIGIPSALAGSSFVGQLTDGSRLSSRAFLKRAFLPGKCSLYLYRLYSN